MMRSEIGNVRGRPIGRRAVLTGFMALLTLPLFAGCEKVSRILPDSTWHEKFGWKAEDYFEDPKVIALCKAIEANDLQEVDRLVAAGADVSAQGKGKMTPLLWAFPDNKLARFTRLLEHGADPNVKFESDFNTRGGISAGDSVTHMACMTEFPGYFEAVFKHGGDPELKRTSLLGMGDTPIFSVIKWGGPNKKQRVQFLIEKGADLNYMNGAGATPAMEAATCGGRYDIALMFLRAGADLRVYRPNCNSRLVHLILAEERRSARWTPEQKTDYRKLLKWLEDHGESLQEAKADRDRWRSWNFASGEYRRKMDAEIAQRKAREAREKEASAEGDKDAVK